MKERYFEPNYESALGLKQGHAITSMPFGSLIDVLNMNLNGKGGKSTRQGYQKLFELPITEKVQSLIDYNKSDGTQLVLAYADDTIYEWDGAAVSSVITGLTAGTPWKMIQFQDRILGVNGADNSFSYDGSAYTKISITAPAHVTLAAAAGGALPAGTHSYVCTFYDQARGAESNPPDLDTAPTATTVPGTQTINFNQPTATAGETVTHLRIYRMLATETVFTLVDEVAYSAGAAYSDAGLTSGSIEVERDTGQEDEGNTPHPQSKIIIEAFNRVFMVDENDPTLLVYSKQGQPHAFPSGNYFPIGDKDGARIIRLEKQGESVLIHKRNSAYILDGDPSTTTPRRISDLGTQDVSTSQSDVGNYCYRLTPKGFWRFVPTDYSTTDLRDEYIGDDVSEEQTLITWSATDDVTTAYYSRNGARHVMFLFPNTSTYQTKALVFDVATEQWVKYQIGTDIFSTAPWEDSGEQKLIFGDGYGIVWEWDSGDADGSDLDADELNGTATSAGATTIEDTSQTWTVDELVGCVVSIIGGTGVGQRRRIVSNTADELTVDTAFSTSLDDTSVYAIAAIEWYGEEFWNSNDHQNMWKRLRWIVPYVRQTASFEFEVSLRRDFDTSYVQAQNINVAGESSLYGFAIYGLDPYGSRASTLRRIRFNGKYHYYTIRYRHQRAAERLFWDGHGTSFQVLYDRNK